MNIPNTLRYTKSHEWVETLPNGNARVGLTDYAQSQLGDIVYINLPDAGDPVSAGERMADVESVKAVTDIYSPFTGAVSAVNDALTDAPEQLNAAPYEAWILEIRDIADAGELLDAAAYEALIGAEG